MIKCRVESTFCILKNYKKFMEIPVPSHQLPTAYMGYNSFSKSASWK